MKKKRLRILLFCILIGGIAGVSVRYMTLNQKYPKTKEVVYETGEPLVLEEIQIIMNAKTVYQQEEFFETYGITDGMVTDYYEYHPTVFLVADFQLKNIGLETRNYQEAFSEDAVEYQTFANGEDSYLFPYINPEEKNWDGDLEPGEEKQVSLVFPVPKDLMTEEHWKKAEMLPYQIVLRNYPEKIILR